MISRSSRWVAWSLAALAAVLGVLAARALLGSASLSEVVASAQAKGVNVEIGSVERGWRSDRLRDVRARLPGGAVVLAPEARLRRRLSAPPALTVPEARITLAGTPPEAFARALELRSLVGVGGAELEVGRIVLDCEHADTGRLALLGVSASGEGEPWKVHAETLRLGGATWSDVTFSVARSRRTLELVLGAGPAALPRATATYVPSDGRASEWRLMVPHQPLGAAAAALGLRVAPEDADARIGGTLSWITPEGSERGSRGSFRFVLDDWPRPPWPEASALTGASGSIAAVLVPGPDGRGLRLERVEIAAALFDLRGTGSIRAGPGLSGTVQASGRRTCAELASRLPPSRHRRAVRSFLGLSPDAVGEDAAIASGSRAGESVELSLRLELSAGSERNLGFYWRLSPGCGIDVLPSGDPRGG